ncbi:MULTISPECIES: hypothetical protein [Streptobacillus]|uniref:hypothetical protein n=1 Tax=Streptobacillus TaxID=34104 RepID=UPI0007E31388|nr:MULTISPECIES: hypothetical protein [Streptobacillus]
MKLKNKEFKIIDIDIGRITEINVTIKDNFSVFYMVIFQGKKCDSFFAYNNENLTEFFIEIMKEFKNNKLKERI